MSLFTKTRGLGDTPYELVPPRSATTGIMVTPETALRHSAVWACVRLRSDLVSTMPVDVFRRIQGQQVEAPKPPVLVKPDGRWSINDWLYRSQVDLDRYGNCVGVIHERDNLGKPRVIELQSMSAVQVKGKGPDITQWAINGHTYTPDQIWHERQYPVAGAPLGLSPVQYAAMSLGGYLAAQSFALDYYKNSTVPMGQLKNTAKTLTGDQALGMKERYKASVANRDIFVTGNDWELDLKAIAANDSAFIDEMRFSVEDVCRFFGVPADLVDSATQSTGVIKYANITQRNLEFLTLNLAPILTRREAVFSDMLVAQPRYVKFNTASLLRMDLTARYAAYQVGISSKFLTADEARDQENMPPLTPEQVAAMPTAAAPPVPTEEPK